MRFSRRSARVYAQGDDADSMAAEWAEHEGEARMFAELRKNQRLLPPLGSPHASTRRYWLRLLLAFAIWEAMYLPYAAAFRYPRNASGALELPRWLIYLQWVSDALFAFEIGLMIRTTLKEPMYKGGEIITDKAIIFREYKRSGRLFIDAFSILPLEFIVLLIPRSGLEGSGVLARLSSTNAVLLRLNRLLHAYRVPAYHGHSIMTLSRPQRSCVSWFLFLLFAHNVACCWWPLGGSNFRSLRTPIDESSPETQQYFTSLYWSLTTLLKVPYVAPSTAIEQLFTNAIMMLGAIAFAFFNAEVHAIVQTNLGGYLRRTNHINSLRTIFTKATREGLAQRTALKWSTASASAERLKGDNIKEQQVLRMLPHNLRAEVWRVMYKELTAPDCGLEGHISNGAMAQIAAACWPAVFLPRQVLVAAYAVTSELYILQRGSLRLSGGVALGSTGPGGRGSIVGGMTHSSRIDKWMRQGYGDRNSIGGAGGASRQSRACSRQTTKNAASFALPVQLPGAENSRFRILERGGAMVGNYETYRSPFIVEAIKLSHVLVLDAPKVLAQMPAVDAATVKSAITRQLQLSIEALTGNRRKTAFRPSASSGRSSTNDSEAPTAGSPLDAWITTTEQSPAKRFLQGASSHRMLRAAQGKVWKERIDNQDMRKDRRTSTGEAQQLHKEAEARVAQVARLQTVFDASEATLLEATTRSWRQELRELRESSTSSLAELEALSEQLRTRKAQRRNTNEDNSFDKGAGIEEMELEP